MSRHVTKKDLLQLVCMGFCENKLDILKYLISKGVSYKNFIRNNNLLSESLKYCDIEIIRYIIEELKLKPGISNKKDKKLFEKINEVKSVSEYNEKVLSNFTNRLVKLLFILYFLHFFPYKMVCNVYDRGEIVSGTLGKGAYSNVYICKKDPNKAIKIISNRDRVTMAEIVILKNFSDDNVINMSEFCFIDKKISYIMDRSIYSFNEFIQNTRYKFKNTVERLSIDICKGLQFLHSNGFLHLDITLSNCLVVNNIGKLADFSLSIYRSDIDKEFKSHHDRVTSTYRPYENLQVENNDFRVYSDKSDVWSLGIVLSSILSGERFIDYEKNCVLYCKKKNYDISTLLHIEKLISWNEWPCIALSSESKWYSILQKMLNINKRERLSIVDVNKSLSIYKNINKQVIIPNIDDYSSKEWFSHMQLLLSKYDIQRDISLFIMKLFYNIEECFEFTEIYEESCLFNIEYWMIGCIRIIDKLFGNNSHVSKKKHFVKDENIYIKIEEIILKWRNGCII